MSSDEAGEAGPPVSREDLINYFHEAGLSRRPGKRGLVGAEFEHLPVSLKDGQAWPWAIEGEDGGVGDAFVWLSERSAYERGSTGDDLVALKRGGAMIHTEPGAQTELATSAFADLHALAAELATVRSELAHAADVMGFAFLSHALQPVSVHGDVSMVPKRRYRALRDYLESHGQARAVDMMMLTASVQACFDYQDEADAGRKMRVALLTAPIAAALFANSPVENGRATGRASNRAAVWLETDRARSGVPAALLDGDWSFERYVDFALGVPSVLVRGERGTVEAGAGATFGDMLQNGFRGRRVDGADWELHLSTLFIEARMKKFIEVRSADCPPPAAAMSVPAFWTGLLYHDASTQAALDLLRPLRNPLATCMGDVARRALGARIGTTSARDLALKLVELARQGLAARALGEEKYLEPALRWADSGRTASDDSLEVFDRGGIAALIDSARLRR